MQRLALGMTCLLTAVLAFSGCSSSGGPATAGAAAARDGVLTRGLAPSAAAKTTRAGRLAPDAKLKNVLYVADQSAATIEIYKQKGSNQQPIGSITEGVSGADGLFVDSKGKLYVCNFGNGTVTVYPRGATSPSETLTGAGSPIDVVTAPNGTVYVANFNSGTDGTVLEYPKGQTTPSKTIVTLGSGSYPEGLALDSSNDLFVAYQSTGGEVLEFKPGSSSGQNLGIHVGAVGGLTIDHHNDLLLDDQALPGVDVYPPGS